MKPTAAELADVRGRNLHIPEKCDMCEKLLNQTITYTVGRKPQVCFSAVCPDRVYFGIRYESRTQGPERKNARGHIAEVPAVKGRAEQGTLLFRPV